jgi:hypothetical protein
VPVTRGEKGMMLFAGPRSRTKVIVLGVVGCQMISKGLQVGTILSGCVSGGANKVCGTCLHILCPGAVERDYQKVHQRAHVAPTRGCRTIC